MEKAKEIKIPDCQAKLKTNKTKYMEVGILSFPKIEGEQCLRLYTYEKNLVLYCTVEVLVMSDESQVEKQDKIHIPFSCKVFLVAWWWQEASSVS